MTFGTGWIRGLTPTPDRMRASAVRIGIAVSRIIPDDVGIALEPYTTNQGSDESCTDHAGTKLIYALTGIRPAPGVAWWAARLFDSPGRPLMNVGVSTAAFLRALREHGACPEPMPHLRYDEEPPAIVRQRAQRCNLSIDPIWGSDAEIVAAVRSGLLDGHPSAVVIAADAEYRNAAAHGGDCGPEVEEGHWHEVPVWRCETRADGSRWYLSPGSWGPTSLVWLHESRIAGSPAVTFATGVS